MASESSQKKKSRVRPPRVHIEYEVETNGAIVMKELPFVVGVMADLAGHNKEQPKLKDRKFEKIDRDDFDKVMKKISPQLKMRVENKLANDGSELSVDLTFGKMDDFSPEAVAGKVEPLAKLVEARNKLKELLARADGNDRLEELLEAVAQNPDAREKLKQKLADADGAPDAGGDAAAKPEGGA